MWHIAPVAHRSHSHSFHLVALISSTASLGVSKLVGFLVCFTVCVGTGTQSDGITNFQVSNVERLGHILDAMRYARDLI